MRQLARAVLVARWFPQLVSVCKGPTSGIHLMSQSSSTKHRMPTFTASRLRSPTHTAQTEDVPFNRRLNRGLAQIQSALKMTPEGLRAHVRAAHGYTLGPNHEPNMRYHASLHESDQDTINDNPAWHRHHHPHFHSGD